MAIDFHEELFPLSLSFGSRVKVDYKTSVLRSRGGDEERVLNWFDPLREYDLSPAILDQTVLDTLAQFFRSRQGPKFGFRFRDPLDSTITTGILATSPGTLFQLQLVKRYTSGLAGDTHTAVRFLEKPVTGTVRMFFDATERFHFVVDTTTGVVSFHKVGEVVDLERVSAVDRIASTTGTNWVTFGVIVGDLVTVVGSVGLDGTYTVTGFADTNQTMEVSGANFTSGELGVTITTRFPAGTSGSPVVVKATCTFDVPVRFVSTTLSTTIANFEDFNAPFIAQELRGNIPANLDALDEAAPPSFVESRLPDELAQGAQIGPEEDVIVFAADSGFENRISRLPFGMLTANISQTVRTLAQMSILLDFFHARKGRFTGFRFKDVTDFQVATATTIGTGDGSVHEFNFVKLYTDSSGTQSRRIKKPIAGTVTVLRDAVPVTTNLTIDTVIGKAIFTIGTITITFVAAGKTLTRSAGSWVTDGVSVSDKIKIAGSVDNNNVFTVTIVTALVLTVTEVVVDEAAIAVSVHLPPLSGEVITWTGDFDVPVRFGTDTIDISLDGFEVRSWSNILLDEITEETCAGSFVAGVSGLVVSGPTVCGSAAEALGPPSEWALRFAEDWLGWKPLVGDKRLHMAAHGTTGWTWLIAFSNTVTPGTVVTLPFPGDNVGGVPLGNQLKIEHLVNGIHVRTAEGSIYRRGVQDITSGEWFCEAGSGGQTDMFSDFRFDTGSVTGNRFNDTNEMTCYVGTVLPTKQQVFISGSIQGIMSHTNPLRGATDQGFLSHFCVSDGSGGLIGSFTNAETYAGENPGGVGGSGAAFVWEAGIGAAPGLTGTPNISNPISFDLYELALFPAIQGFDDEEIIHRMHFALLRYLFNKYAVGINVPMVPLPMLYGWFEAGNNVFNSATPTAKNIGFRTGGPLPGDNKEISRWTSQPGGIFPVVEDSKSGFGPNRTPTYVNVTPAPLLPKLLPFQTFRYESPVVAREELV